MWRKKKPPAHRATTVSPEAFVSGIVGTPMSHESVLLLARLQSIADQLERAVLRLEKQTDDAEAEEAEATQGERDKDQRDA